jgi:hypothetical protein
MKAIDVKTCIGKEVILLDHLRITHKDHEVNSDEFLYSSQTRPAQVLAIAPSGDFVLVSIIKDCVIEYLPSVPPEGLINETLIEALRKMSPRSSHRFVTDRTWIPTADFNEAGTEVPTNMNGFKGLDNLKRLSVVEIVEMGVATE